VIKKIKNVDSVEHVWCGQTIPAGEFYTLQFADDHQQQDDDYVQAIVNDLAELYVDDILLTKETAIRTLTKEFRSSVAVDRNGTHQDLSGTNWIELESTRTIWDIESNYDEANNDFVVPYEGIYFTDGQIHFKNLVGVTNIEVALFKRGEPDDYWFILEEQETTGLVEAHFDWATSFDMYEGERFCIKIKLSGLLPSCDVDGDDDVTAWGYNIIRNIY
jgi:hypothetical protein